MKKRFLLPVMLSIIYLGCTYQEKQKNNAKDNEKYLVLEKIQWLIGNWQSKSANGLLTEIWRKQDDSTMIGQSYFISGSDTLSKENICMEQRNGMLKYIPTVSNQNNGKAVYFTLTHIADSVMVFENPEHDFPQKISYVSMRNDSLVAEISALTDGKERSKKFRMGKVKGLP